MKLKFKIDKNYLIKHTLLYAERGIFSSDKYKEDILKFSNYVLKEYPKYYDFLVGLISPEDIEEENIDLFTKELNKELHSTLNKIKRSKEFEKIYDQTEKYLLTLKKQWEKNLDRTEKHIKDITGFNLNKKFTVYITHSNQRNGSYWGNNKISWGVKEKWENYTTIYLWHEILHSYFSDSDMDHAIIELITDEELRSCLNNVKYPPFEGHKNLAELKKKILPYWKKYLRSDIRDINKLQKELKSI